MLADELDYVIGVDTHRDEHALVVVSAGGAVLAERAVRADASGYRSALAFADRFASGRRVWAIEGAGSYGAGLARMLVERGETVLEAGRPARAQRRSRGKDDALDAVLAARGLLTSEVGTVPRDGGRREALRLLLITRRSAVDARRHALVQMRAVIVTCPDALREQLRGLLLAGFGAASLRAPADRISVRVRVTTHPATIRKVQLFSLTCNPTGGTSPLAARVCRDVSLHPKAMLAPPRRSPGGRSSVCSGSEFMPVLSVTATANGTTRRFTGTPGCSWPGDQAVSVYFDAAQIAACWRKKTRHDKPLRSGAGATPAPIRTLRTVVAEIATPTPLSSPTILRYPQRGFSLARRTINATTDGSSAGRPGRRCAYDHRRATSRRCQPSNVSGPTTKLAHTARGSERLNAARNA